MITVKKMKEWLSGFDDDQEVYMDSMNYTCARRLGFCLTGGEVNVEQLKHHKAIQDKKNNNGTYICDTNHYLDNDRKKEIIDEMKNFIERNKVDWSDKKLQEENDKLKNLTKTFASIKRSPIIYLDN